MNAEEKKISQSALLRCYGEHFGLSQAERFLDWESVIASDKYAEECGLATDEYVVDDRMNRCDFCMGRLPFPAIIERGEKLYCCSACDRAGEGEIKAFSPRKLVMDAIFHLAEHRSSSDRTAINLLREAFRLAPALAAVEGRF